MNVEEVLAVGEVGGAGQEEEAVDFLLEVGESGICWGLCGEGACGGGILCQVAVGFREQRGLSGLEREVLVPRVA